ncbi:MAG: hypothetical protein IJA34_06565 [Lachnospiraceae bacterium]|nr:hypothetical protein [Lachnospiraceae bacterium]
MKKVKTNKLGRRILSFMLTVALMVGLMPGNVMTVRAEESSSTELSVTAFATPEQLMSSDNFALHTDTGRGTAQKVYFGTNGSNKQTWYIAGSDATYSIVLLCDPSLPMATGTMFEDDWENNKTYSADWRCTYETAPNEVYPNHYGASDLRGVLQGYTSNDNTGKFSAAEKGLMQSTKVYTDDDKRKDEGETDYTYYTEDVLYPAYGDFDDDQYITVGANSEESLNGGLKVSLKSAPYNSGDDFWLRAPYINSYVALVATPGGYVGSYRVFNVDSVVPAFRLNLSSVLFASAATAATSDASLTDTMTFRVDGDDKITSQASYSTDNVIVDAAEEETVYLYVQGKNGTTDWVYSQEVSADTTIATGTIKSGAKDSNGSAVSLTSVDLSQCEIWIEKKVTDDNLVYAVMAKEFETIATVAVTDITAPVAGAELDVVATCNTTGVSTTTPTVSYTKNGESVSGNAAGYLAGYTATVELGAAVGYKFTNETTATINGNEASVSYDADTGKLTVSYTFDKTAKLPLGNAYYVTKDELMSSFDLDGTDDTVGKVYFGTNGSNKQTWYIAGSDASDSIVLLCDPSLPMATGTMFEDNRNNNKTYSADWRCTYETAPNKVYPNHYGASDLRLITLPSLESSAFSTSEQDMMLATKVYTDDDKRKDESETDYTYYTEDVLYPAYGDINDKQYITVGANSEESLNGGLKVSLKSAPYNSGDYFWLRAPSSDYSNYAHVVNPGYYVLLNYVNNARSVVPAFRLNLSSVLFASAATAATSDASLTDTLTFRVDDTEKIKSKAAYTTCGVTVNYDEGDGNVFLYVQDADSVYSVKITEDTIVALSDMTGINNLTDESTKIWLEKSEDNVAYAVMAEALLTEHIPNADDGDCTTAITCSSCGTVTTEAKENHIDDNGDGICDNCDYLVAPARVDEYYQIANANNLMWFAQQVNEGRTTINAKLTADIDMKDIDWTTMSSFAGTFDGDGHTILYLCADENGGDDDIANGSRCGLFQTLSVGGTVTNLTISGAQLWSAHSAGAIAAVNNGTISKCIVKDSTIELGASHGLAAIAGTNTGTVTDCGVVNCFLQRRWGAANSSDYAIGVIVEDNSGTVSNCFSYGCTFSNSSNLFAIVESGNAPVNCYYYTAATVSDTAATSKTVEAFENGEVAYLLNGSSSENVTWYQTLETDTYPVPDNTHGMVYYGYVDCQSQDKIYANTELSKDKPEHIPNEDDGNCTTPVTCSVCGKVTTEAKPHTDENSDNKCDECGSDIVVCTEHIPNADDGDCTTAITCSVCGEVTTEAKATHTPNEDDGDCTTAITCSVCGKVTTAAKATHTPNADDGDCTTAVTCSVCGKVTTEAGHVDANSDGKCDVCGLFTDGIGANLAGYTISLNGNIGVNFYMELDTEVVGDTGAYMLFTLPNGDTEQVAIADATQNTTLVEGKTYYIFSCEVASYEMAQSIKAQMFDGNGNGGKEYSYTVRDYAEYIINNTASYSTDGVAFAKALLNYGACSQTYFEVETGNLANKNLDAADQTVTTLIASDLETYKVSATSNELGTFAGYSLTLKSETTLKAYFKPAEGVDVSNLTFTANGQTVTPTKSGDYYVLSLENIKAWDLDTSYAFKVSNGSVELEFSCSALSYGYSVLNKGNSTYPDTLIQLISALRVYQQKSEVYVSGNN